jgi:hypothetical protein
VAIAFAVTLIFRADVDAQVVLCYWSPRSDDICCHRCTLGDVSERTELESLSCHLSRVCLHNGQNIHERPEGIKIASFFILAIVIASLVSRVMRTTELRVERLELDDVARDFIRAAGRGTIRIIANRKDQGDLRSTKRRNVRSALTTIFRQANR